MLVAVSDTTNLRLLSVSPSNVGVGFSRVVMVMQCYGNTLLRLRAVMATDLSFDVEGFANLVGPPKHQI